MHTKQKGGAFRQKEKVQQFIAKWRQKASEEELLLLLEDLPQRRRQTNETAFFYYLEDVLYNVMFFFSDAVRAKLATIGFDDRIYRWFVPLEDILGELDRLDASGEVCLPDEQWVLESIESHLHAQWWKELSEWLDSTEKKPSEAAGAPLNSTIGPVDSERELKDDSFLHVLPEDILALQQVAGELECTMSPEEADELVRTAFGDDKRTIFLGGIAAESKGAEEHGEAFLLSFFALFKLLDKHRTYLSEEEYLQNYANRERPYPMYQVEMVLYQIMGYMDYRHGGKRHTS